MKRQKYKNIAIIKLSALGDIVHTIPAFQILRKYFTHSMFTWFAEPIGAKLLSNFDGIDKIVPVNLKSGSPLRIIRNLRRTFASFRGQFDLVIDFQGLIKSAIFASLLKGDIIGFDKDNLRESQARFFYKRKASSFDETQHVIFKNIHLVRDLLIEDAEPSTGELPLVEYPIKRSPASPKLKHFLDSCELEENSFIILNVGGGWETKLLSIEQNINLVEQIKSRFKIILLWGTDKEKIKAKKISAVTGVPVADFFDFSELIEFIRQSRLIVTADTLAMHLADAVNIPSVGIFGPTSPFRNGSLLKQSVAVYENYYCGFCYRKKCDTIDCIKNIKTGSIVDAIDKVIEK